VRRLLLTGVLIVGALSGFIEGQTEAFLTTSKKSVANQFTAGTLTLSAGVTSGTLNFPDYLGTNGGLVPGDTFSAKLTIQNTGNLDMRYAMDTSITGDATLAQTLNLTIRLKAAGDTCTNSSQTGTILYGPARLDQAVIGDTSEGQQSGDRILPANAGAASTEDLCFTIVVPSNASTSLQETTLSATFRFWSHQKAGT
jgi:hypothetical protein